ncbi:MAG: FAD-binding protein, partial [Saprospiraceae bacterium]
MANISIPTLSLNGVTYYLPRTNDEVKTIIRSAKNADKKISLRGSAHSFPLIKDNEATNKYIYVMLSNMRAITAFDHNTGIVTVQAGCNLGLDPNDPTGTSTVENSLLYQLDPFDLKKGKRPQPPGWALPDLGGITHQTVGGFMATGSSGGTTSAAFEEAILSVDIIHHDGNDAVIKTFSRPTNNLDDPFYGVAFAHLGLMGIVVSATFQCIRGFNILGSEAVTHSLDCSIDLFGDGDTYEGKPRLSLQDYFEQKNLYTRFMWWPQSTTDLIVLWQANAHEASSDWETWQSNPYQEFPVFLGSMT